MTSQVMAQHIEHWPIDKLIPYARNARTHSDAQMAQSAASIREFGLRTPSWWIATLELSPVTGGCWQPDNCSSKKFR